MSLGRLIGTGNTADVYEWESDKVLKLFHRGYPKDAIDKEYNNAVAIRNTDFLKPCVYDLISFGDRWGIVYEKTAGETLLERLMKSGDIKNCAACMSGLHKQILRNKAEKVPYYKDFLRGNISPALPPDKRMDLCLRIDRLEDGNVLCHGDFHPGNILISDGKAYVIDFMNICRGSRLYDIARTVFLLEYSPIPPEIENRDVIMGMRKELADLYMMQMNVTRDMLMGYLKIIGEVRDREWRTQD